MPADVLKLIDPRAGQFIMGFYFTCRSCPWFDLCWRCYPHRGVVYSDDDGYQFDKVGPGVLTQIRIRRRAVLRNKSEAWVGMNWNISFKG